MQYWSQLGTKLKKDMTQGQPICLKSETDELCSDSSEVSFIWSLFKLEYMFFDLKNSLDTTEQT